MCDETAVQRTCSTCGWVGRRVGEREKKKKRKDSCWIRAAPRVWRNLGCAATTHPDGVGDGRPAVGVVDELNVALGVDGVVVGVEGAVLREQANQGARAGAWAGRGRERSAGYRNSQEGVRCGQGRADVRRGQGRADARVGRRCVPPLSQTTRGAVSGLVSASMYLWRGGGAEGGGCGWECERGRRVATVTGCSARRRGAYQ